MDSETRTLQGWIPELASEAEIRGALDKAFDYRGDVTITLKNGTTIDGYIFDRRCSGPALADCAVRLMRKSDNARQVVCYSDIARLEFSGRDTAEGKSFELWIRRDKDSS